MAMPQKIESNQNTDSCNKNTLILLIDKWKQRPCRLSILYPDYRKQQADCKCQKCLDPHQTEASAKHFNLAYRNQQAEAMQARHSNPAYRKQEADAKYQKHLNPHHRQKEASAKHSNLAYRKQEAEARQAKPSNPVYRKQEADTKHKHFLSAVP